MSKNYLADIALFIGGDKIDAPMKMTVHKHRTTPVEIKNVEIKNVTFEMKVLTERALTPVALQVRAAKVQREAQGWVLADVGGPGLLFAAAVPHVQDVAFAASVSRWTGPIADDGTIQGVWVPEGFLDVVHQVEQLHGPPCWMPLVACSQLLSKSWKDEAFKAAFLGLWRVTGATKALIDAPGLHGPEVLAAVYDLLKRWGR